MCRLIISNLLLILSFSGIGKINKTKYTAYRKTADSIIELYYGKDNLPYISFDSGQSYYGTLKLKGPTYTYFTEKLTYEPEEFCFHYYFKHPKFKGDTLNIQFFLDEAHIIMRGMNPYGLFDFSNLKEWNLLSKEDALKIAKSKGIRKPLHDYEIILGWLTQESTINDYKKFKQFKDYKEVVKGRIVWRVVSEFRVAKPMDEDDYSDIYAIDGITGDCLGIEHQNYDWN